MTLFGATAGCWVPVPRAELSARRPTPDTPPYTGATRFRDSARGIHLPPKTLEDIDYTALDILQPEAVVLLSAQLGDPDPTREVEEDPQLQWWLASRPSIMQIVRLWPVKRAEDPERLAGRITQLHHRFP
jgi:hypothetical protein